MIQIRAALGSDRAALAAVISSDATFKPDEVAVALELVDASLAGSTDYALRVASDGGRVVGYICFGRTPMTAATWDLYWVVVHADARGQGLAGRLIDAMEGHVASTGGGHVRVETSETEGYGSARSLYEKRGYPEASRLVDFYGPGDALITYYKRIDAVG